jgi:hypothetical protein
LDGDENELRSRAAPLFGSDTIGYVDAMVAWPEMAHGIVALNVEKLAMAQRLKRGRGDVVIFRMND